MAGKLNLLEKKLVATGLVLAKDYLTSELKSPQEEIHLALTVVNLAKKLGVTEELGKAFAETASFGQVFREIAKKVKAESEGT